MNEARRKEIEKARAMIGEAKSILEQCRDEEQETFDNMPESFQAGEKGEKAQAAVDALEDAINNCDEVDSSLDTAVE